MLQSADPDALGAFEPCLRALERQRGGATLAMALVDEAVRTALKRRPE